MISITIQNPHEHSAIELRLLGDYLYSCAHEKDAPIAASGPKLADALARLDAETTAAMPHTMTENEKFAAHLEARRDPAGYAARMPHFTIDPADRPDAGAPAIDPVAVAQDEQDDAPTATPEPTEVFGHMTASGAPIIPPAPAPAFDSEGERDSAGVVWNADMHSRTKSKNADGTWRAKRGVAKESEPAAAPEGVIPAPWPFTPPASIVPPPAPAIAVPPAPPVAADVAPANIVSFPALMQKISPAVAAGKLTQDQVVAIVTRYGVPSLALLAARADLIPSVSAEIDALVGA